MDDTMAEFDRKRSLKDQLKAKSRRRREGQASLSQLSAQVRPLRNDALPALETVHVPLKDLRSPTRKIRNLDPAHVRDVAAVISELGFCVPILIGKNNVVIDGAVRLQAAKLLRLGRAPCIRIEHLTDEEQRLLRLAANRLGEKGVWNLDELKIEFQELIFKDAPIEVSGFTLDEIDQILIGDEAEAVEQGPLEPEGGALASARVGDVFELGPHRIICGDAADPAVLRLLMHRDPAARHCHI
jgi:hypothetical protein